MTFRYCYSHVGSGASLTPLAVGGNAGCDIYIYLYVLPAMLRDAAMRRIGRSGLANLLQFAVGRIFFYMCIF